MTTQQMIEQVGPETYLDPEAHYDLMFGDAPLRGEIISAGDLDDIARHLSEQQPRRYGEQEIEDLLDEGEALLRECRRDYMRTRREALHRAVRAAGRSA